MKNTSFLKTLLVFSILLSGCLFSQKASFKNILKSTDIKEIEEYLRTAHPEDPKRSVLKPKLIALKNEAWTKGAKDAKPMAARTVNLESSVKAAKTSNPEEAEEFKKLMAESSSQHNEKTVKLLNTLFDEDEESTEAILLFKNNSDCNMILRIQGKDSYNLAIPAHGENTIVVNKGTYKLNSDVCSAKYSSQKAINKSQIIQLDKPVYQITGNNKDNAKKQL